MRCEIMRSRFESTLWDTAISEANLRAHTDEHWPSARRTMYHMVLLRHPMVEDYARCLVLAMRCCKRPPAWIMSRQFDDPKMTADLTDAPSSENIAEFCHGAVAAAEAYAKQSLADQSNVRLGEWQGPDLGWWISNGDGLFSRAESKMTASIEEMKEHYFNVTPA